MHARAMIGLGSNAEPDPIRPIAAALAGLDRDGLRVAGAGRLVRGPYVPATEGVPDVVNTVVEVATSLDPADVLVRCRALEESAGRRRGDPTRRTLDVDLLAYDDVVLDAGGLTLPHPRAVDRAFVLAPWEEVAPRFVLPAVSSFDTATVVEHAARLRRDDPHAFDALEGIAAPPFADRGRTVEVLPDRAALDAWRGAREGRLGLVPTMGALHTGHAALVQRAAAECDAVLATLFVNPLQFAPGEDLARYPRTFEADCALLGHHGAHAVYAPDATDLYPPGFATHVVPAGAAEGYEAASRPTHFQGVTTVVLKLWLRTRPDRLYFGRKDAQQVAVIEQMRRDLDLPGRVAVCPTVRAADGLALSSRNRYFDPAQRALARNLSKSLEAVVREAAAGRHDGRALGASARERIERAGLAVDYADVVDPDRMTPIETLSHPVLVVAAARVGDVRILDNRWIAPAVAGRSP